MSKVLSVPSVPLSGLHMIEASAGTGKTWTIAALYLRLLLECSLPVEKILVVTYTNAATAELRARIRARLLDAQQSCMREGEEADDVLADILKRVALPRAQALLTLALESFDLAAIHTIHGFCQRALSERAFESGQPFEFELAADDRRVLHEAVEDFWRSKIARDADPLWLGWLLNKLPGPDALLRQLLPHFGKPYLRHDLPLVPDAAAGQRFVETFARVRLLWQREGAAAMQLLAEWPGMNGKSHSQAQIALGAKLLNAWLCGLPTLAFPEKAERLASSGLKVNKGASMPTHVVFDALDELLLAQADAEAAFTARLGHLQQSALQACEASIRAARQRLSLRSFDDLLLDLHAALTGEGGAALAAAMRERYGAALIDEFQDTDPLQFEIFRRVFCSGDSEGEAPARSPSQTAAGSIEPSSLSLLPEEEGKQARPSHAGLAGLGKFCSFVGDPKQAIYSFRGADLRAYLDARAAAGETLLLDTNRRSSAALIDVVNGLFAKHPRPFLDRELSFEAVKAPANAPAAILLDELPLPALECWFMPRDEGEAAARKSGPNKGRFGSIAKGRAEAAIAKAVATNIAALLAATTAGRVRLEDKGHWRALEGRDIAVLVKSHKQGEAVHAALQSLGVASVRYGGDSIFETEDAVEVERVLLAIAHPGREGLVRAALVTRLMGVQGNALAALDSNAWLAVLERFHRWHVLARDHGFIRMWRSWQMESGVAVRLLALPDGERRMTNLQHLSDLLATLAHDDNLGIEALAKHLADARNDARGETNTGEGRLLRLESDENLVRIVTIHTAKGLEYPVTYCPFLWDGSVREPQPPLRYHDAEAEHEAALDFGSPALAAHQASAQHEQRAEALRLAYVALTRARQHCVLVWGACKDAEASPLSWLLCGEQVPDFGVETDADLRARLNAWQGDSAEIKVQDLPVPEQTSPPQATGHAHADFGQKNMHARPWPAQIAPPWRMHSYSAWLLNPKAADESPDHDETAPVPVAEEISGLPLTPALSPAGRGGQDGSAAQPLAGLRQFPCGANAGTCLHAMFERADFIAPQDEVIAEALAEFGFEQALHGTALQLVQETLHTPLSDTLPPLRDIPLTQQIREMEFMLPIGHPDMQALAAAIGAGQGADGRLDERVRQLQPAQLGGFLKGFVDLVFAHEARFYVLDYKSNFLGHQAGDYGASALAEEMAAAMYDLQALLYTVALHQALMQRQPGYDYEQHMGSSLYLFLRGMQRQAPGSGVFAWRPSRETVERVAAVLAGTEKVFAYSDGAPQGRTFVTPFPGKGDGGKAREC